SSEASCARRVVSWASAWSNPSADSAAMKQSRQHRRNTRGNSVSQSETRLSRWDINRLSLPTQEAVKIHSSRCSARHGVHELSLCDCGALKLINYFAFREN